MCDLEIIDALKLEKQTRFWFCFLCFCSQCSVKCSKLENEISFRKRSFIFQRLLHSTRFNSSYECLILPHEIKSRNRHFLGGNRSNSKVEIFQILNPTVTLQSTAFSFALQKMTSIFFLRTNLSLSISLSVFVFSILFFIHSESFFQLSKRQILCMAKSFSAQQILLPQSFRVKSRSTSNQFLFLQVIVQIWSGTASL
jgi:hypothetical protein